MYQKEWTTHYRTMLTVAVAVVGTLMVQALTLAVVIDATDSIDRTANCIVELRK